MSSSAPITRIQPDFPPDVRVGIIARVLLFVIRVYQLTLSKLIGPVCRFEPSCSRYAAACIHDHGALRGSLLSARRLCKCHPFHAGGFDPPPPRNGASVK